ncbi:MAG: hypothetical protein KDH99_04600, partial [Alcanivoracaceae bacterium]|nr:hypothetical protein [Alcanivoracaceae bacterium]
MTKQVLFHQYIMAPFLLRLRQQRGNPSFRQRRLFPAIIRLQREQVPFFMENDNAYPDQLVAPAMVCTAT